MSLWWSAYSYADGTSTKLSVLKQIKAYNAQYETPLIREIHYCRLPNQPVPKAFDTSKFRQAICMGFRQAKESHVQDHFADAGLKLMNLDDLIVSDEIRHLIDGTMVAIDLEPEIAALEVAVAEKAAAAPPAPEYLIEIDKSGRAGCKACKNKINRGDLRLGTRVMIRDHVTYAWRHFACVTTKQIQNIKKAVGGAADMAGFSTLSDGDKLVCERVIG